MKTKNRQEDSSKTEPYAQRLREERLRVEPHQGQFCAQIGVPRGRQSFLENGDRELRADYLELISQHGLDIQFIVTGRRGGELLSVTETNLLDAFRSLDAEGQQALLTLLNRLDRRDPTATLHDNRTTYRGDMND